MRGVTQTHTSIYPIKKKPGPTHKAKMNRGKWIKPKEITNKIRAKKKMNSITYKLLYIITLYKIKKKKFFNVKKPPGSQMQ